LAGTVLVIERDRDLGDHLRALFEQDGNEVTVAGDGPAALRAFHAVRPDLVVLDDAVVGLDGFTLLQRVRDLSDVPILVLTAESDASTRIRGFRAGADAYLRRPFDDEEVVTKAATLRRRGPRQDRETVYRDARVTVDFAAAAVVADGREVAATPTEFRILTAFVRHPGQVLSPTQLLHLAWDDASEVGSDRVKFAILRLRRKLGWTGAASPLETVRGFGYRYNAQAPPVDDPTARPEGWVREGAVSPYLSEAVIVIDGDGTVTRTIGPPGGVLGYGDRMGITLIDHVHPDDRDRAVEVTLTVLTAPLGTTDRVTLRLRHADASWHRYEILVANHFGDGEIDGVLLRARELEPDD
jgi:DNA-binding response OmpR family regulator